MKILYITVPSFFDLEISLIRELSKNNEVKVIMFLTPPSCKSSAFSIQKLSEQCGLIGAAQYEGLERYDKLINVDDWIIANNPTNSIFNAVKLTIQINRYVSYFKPDVVHFTNFSFNMIGSIVCLNSKIKRILTIHDPESHDRQRLINRILKKIGIWRAKNILFLSEPPLHVKQKIQKICRSIHYSSLGPYDFLEHYIQSGSQNSYGKYILFFGRIERYKGIDILIESFIHSNACANGYKLVIAGKGSIGIFKEHENIQIINRYIENQEIASLIKNSQFVVLPYRSATQSGVVMSAFALGKPVIATNVGNFSDILSDGKYGVVVESEDVSGLTASIDSLIEDTCRLKTLSDNIIRDYNVEGIYGWKSIAEKLTGTYKSLE